MYARCAGISWGFWRAVTLTFDRFDWKLALYLLELWGTFTAISIFLRFLFLTYESVRNRRTDGRTNGHARHIMQPVGWPHDKIAKFQYILYYTKLRLSIINQIPFLFVKITYRYWQYSVVYVCVISYTFM